ncbi:unnamed protein product [Closterium sp. Yama58-4]|nr:unnamed protein product [Closterium sp. Yama58-4]
MHAHPSPAHQHSNNTLACISVLTSPPTTGFCTVVWLTATLFKANDFIRKQGALKVRLSLSQPLVTNDVLVRFMAMAVKCGLLVAHRHSKGMHNRHQAQILTLVEYTSLLYRAFVPAPVWFQFFLNDQAYGRLTASLTAGLYLAFKLSTSLDRVLLFVSAVRQAVGKGEQYGTEATPDEVAAAGNMCAICQEHMTGPVTLRCRHVFCDECVSEWFERERTCPLCRMLVKPAGLRSFSDANTSLLVQLF